MIQAYPIEWFKDVVVDHDKVEAAVPIDDCEVRLDREGLSPITVVPVRSNRLSLEDLENVLAEHRPTLVVLVNRDGHYTWDARTYAVEQGASIHTFKELYTFLSDSDPRPGLNKNVSFVRSRLEQHNKVAAVSMACEAAMQIDRKGGLPSLQLSVEDHYEFTEEALVGALKHHPDVDIICNANPNGTITEAALDHASHAGVEVLDFKDLMGRLHRS
jgi:hypothetical protein